MTLTLTMTVHLYTNVCHFCFQNNESLIDDEYHLIMECEQVNDIRNTYIRDYKLYTTFATFLDLMKTSNTYKLKQLSQFLFYAMSIKKKYCDEIVSTKCTSIVMHCTMGQWPLCK